MPLMSTLYIFCTGFGLSLILTPLARKLALKTGHVAVPTDDRWHKKETALLGGISIFASTMIAWLIAFVLNGWTLIGVPFTAMMLCSAGVFALGLADDLSTMAPQHKLAGLVAITALLVFFGFRLNWTGSETVNLCLSILWIVGITNAFNLLDNMDGLSCGIAFIAGSFLLLYMALNPHPGVSSEPLFLLTSGYLGAILGFLIYNFHPASIFMGDAGSLFIGFVLACLTVTGSPSQARSGGFLHLLSVIAIPVLILFIPILDTGFVSLMRKLFRRPISKGGRDHSSHRMVAIGFSEKKAVWVLYAFAIASGLMALTVNRLSIGTSLLIIAFYLLFILFFWIYLAKVKVYSEASIIRDKSTRGITPLLVEITFRRRLFEVLLDLVLIAIAYYTAYLLRFEGTIGPNFEFFLNSLPILIACQILAFFFFGIYRGVWESTGIRDLIGYIKAITTGTIAPILILLFFYRFHSFSRAVFVIYWGLMLILISLSRLSFRLLDEGIRRSQKNGKSVLIYGAGLGGQMLVREIETNRQLGMAVAGFMDDNPSKQKRKILGYPVFGGLTDLEKIIEKHAIREIIVAFKEDRSEKKRELKALCQQIGTNVEIKEMKLTIS
ncbi:MAG: glycosyl transferase [Deltaproteobacteria bacterium]|nr:glycosyl transferase [Deltaproteobacteria bacterium]